jgi:hypothetical protein
VVEEEGVCSLLSGVDSRGNGTATGATAAAQSPALPLLPQIIGLPKMLHARTLNNIRFNVNKAQCNAIFL